MENPSAALLFEVGQLLCALPLTAVRETLRPLPVEPLRHPPPFVDGVATVRGRPTPVVNGARLLGRERGEPTRWVLLASEDAPVALAVDAVVGVRALATSGFDALPPLLGGVESSVVQRIGMLDARLLAVLDAARMVPDEVRRSVIGGHPG